MSKSRLTVLFWVAVFVLFSSNTLFSQGGYKVQYRAEFSKEEFSFEKLLGYDLVRLKSGGWLSDLAKPMLPSKELRIALPAGMKVTDAYVTDAKSEEIQGTYNIFPAQPPRKVGLTDEDIEFIEPDQATYSSNQPYPSKLVQFVQQSDLAGQSIVLIALYPLQYVPVEKRVTLYTSLSLVIEGEPGYEYGDYLSPNIREEDKKVYEEMLKGMVINPEEIEVNTGLKLGKAVALPPGSFAHIVITSSTLSSAFQPLVDWHTRKGVKDTVITNSWIYANYSGADNQEKIRNFIMDAHSTWGTTYFLLGGENETVPFQFKTYYDESAPSDQYYSDYDDDWTNEVFVGRIPAGNTSTVTTFVNKVLKYEKDPARTGYPLDVLLVGMDLDASTPCEYMKEDIAANIPLRFNVTKVYDSDATNHRTAVINALNSGQNLVNHADHSNITVMGTGDRNHGWGINNSDVDGLTNDGQLSIVVSMGCHPNHMDYNECIAERFVEYNSNQAGVAFNGNTRSGWYYGGDPYSLSSALDVQWWMALFGRNKYNLGQTIADSKHNFDHTGSVEKQCEWVFNLLGEPEMPIWTDEPDSFAVRYPGFVPIGTSSFVVHVEDSTTLSPVYQAYVCLWKGNEVYLTGYTDVNGNKVFYPSPSTQGTMYVTVTKRNYLPYTGQASVASPMVITLPASEVEEDTANIHGRLESDGGYEADCWLMWDTDSGELYAHSESLGVLANGSEFSSGLSSLSEGTLYYYVAKAHNIAGWSSGAELLFLTKPLPPSALTAQATGYSTINLTWTKPQSADKTLIERDSVPDWTRGEGILVYDDTGSSFQDSGLEPLTHYYYQAWSYCSEGELGQYSDELDSAEATTLFWRGDANADKQITVSDVIYLINYLFKGGPAPLPEVLAGDANCDGQPTVSDVIYIINYLFKGGPAPIC